MQAPHCVPAQSVTPSEFVRHPPLWFAPRYLCHMPPRRHRCCGVVRSRNAALAPRQTAPMYAPSCKRRPILMRLRKPACKAAGHLDAHRSHILKFPAVQRPVPPTPYKCVECATLALHAHCLCSATIAPSHGRHSKCWQFSGRTSPRDPLACALASPKPSWRGGAPPPTPPDCPAKNGQTHRPHAMALHRPRGF